MNSQLKNVKKNLDVMHKEVDFSALLITYKSELGYWRSFAYPYDVTAQAPSKKNALEKLRILVQDYQNALKEYGYADHLVHPPITRLEDRKKFDTVFSSGEITGDAGQKASIGDCYVETI